MSRILSSLIALLLILLGTAFASERVPIIGMKVPNGWSEKAKVKLCVTQPAHIDPCFERYFDGVRYTVAFSKATKRITYLFTEDEKFRTADGFRVGDGIAVSEENVRAWPGWQIHGTTTSGGWRPLIGWDMEVKLKDGSVLNLRVSTMAAVMELRLSSHS